ncbi:hypothetical protein [Nostoc sp. 106C]|uniref:hypothetical protein n=1 Tax=Nostoc sp. 106C TaxID=1932667 RepID=UPI001412B149|nr:hypothetical protein [Nostoc sp. 106C]
MTGSLTPVATTEGTSLRVHQSPTAGNPPLGLDSPQRTGSSSRETLSAVAHGGNPQDRTASPRNCPRLSVSVVQNNSFLRPCFLWRIFKCEYYISPIMYNKLAMEL